jgi:F-type H+-transporting ATPase subunit alpha
VSSGMVLNLEEDNIGCVILGPYTEIQEGDEVKRTGRIMEVPVGRSLNRPCCQSPWDEPLDGKGPIKASPVTAPLSFWRRVW